MNRNFCDMCLTDITEGYYFPVNSKKKVFTTPQDFRIPGITHICPDCIGKIKMFIEKLVAIAHENSPWFITSENGEVEESVFNLINKLNKESNAKSPVKKRISKNS